MAVGLLVCLLVGMLTPVYAADPDMGGYLAKALSISQSDLNNYSANYKNSLPVTYKKNANSYYVALGGSSADGTTLEDSSKCYADQLAAKLGVEYEPYYAQGGLEASGAVAYVKKRAKVLASADLITFQIDAEPIVTTSAGAAANEGKPDLAWGKYITDAALLAEIKAFNANMVAEYSAEFGKDAQSLANVLERMLFECVVYGNETINAVKEIRNHNSNALVLILGLYNPAPKLSVTNDGKTINIGGIVNEMIKVCNAYLLKQTSSMNNTAFIDITTASTAGFGSLKPAELAQVITDSEKLYANQKGHDYIVSEIQKAICDHPSTTVTGKKDATCKENGYTGDTVCTVCNRVVKKGSSTDKAAHDYTAWSQTSAPTCTDKGTESRSCKVCGLVESKKVDAKGHAWDKGTVTTEPTCTKEGVKTYTCTTCKETKTEKIDKIAHAWDKGTVTTEPTCETKGKKTLTCAVCKETKTESISATGHAWDNGLVTTEPTCVAEGVKTTTCTTCNKTKTAAIPTIDHTWDEGTVTTAPGCETEGEKTTTCTVCGKTSTETVPATGHTWDDGKVTTEAGCETVGHKTTTCTGCGKTTTETIPATGHTFGEYTSNGDATCQKDGTKTSTCEGCGAKDTVADVGSKTGHTYKDGVCSGCGAAEEITPNEPGEEKPSDEKEDNGTVVWVIVGVSAAVVLAGAGAGFWFFKRKRIV